VIQPSPSRPPRAARATPARARRAPITGANPHQQLRSFYRIARLGSAAMSPEELAGLALKEFCRTLGFRRAEIWLLGPERRRIRCLSTFGFSYVPPTKRVNPRDCPFTTMLLRRRQAIHHPDVCRLSPIDKWKPWQVVTSVFGAPLRARGRVIGTLCADRGGEPFEMPARQLELGSVLSALVAEVIDSSVECQAEAKRHRQMILLNRACRAISREGRLPVLLPRLARMIREHTASQAVRMGLADQARKEMEVVASSGPEGVPPVGRRVPINRRQSLRCPAMRAFILRKPIVVEDAAEITRAASAPPETRSSLAIPIGSQGSVVGALRLDASRPYVFDDDDVKVFSILGEQIGHAVRRARVLEALQRKQSDLEAVSESLETRLEEDRRRIARELHDEIGQSMTAAKINLGLLLGLSRGAGEDVRRLLSETAADIDRTIAETRRISMDLRPSMLDELGLLPALRWYASTFARRTGVRVEVAADNAGPRPRREVETLLYRFVQEALTNVARHARARRVRVSLAGANGTVRAIVQDDGVGFAGNGSRPGGLGLLGMRERIERQGGTLRIGSRPAKGTRLVADIPVHPVPGARPAGPARRRTPPVTVARLEGGEAR
jgi:signal transduction histidine kinase